MVALKHIAYRSSTLLVPQAEKTRGNTTDSRVYLLYVPILNFYTPLLSSRLHHPHFTRFHLVKYGKLSRALHRAIGLILRGLLTIDLTLIHEKGL